MEYAWTERGPATSLSATAAARALVGAYKSRTGAPPSLPLAELNLAHLWLETKAGTRMWRFNWGNLSAGGYVDGAERISWAGDFWRPPWFAPAADASSSTLALHDKMLAGTAPSAFRGYQSHEEGARDYVDLLSRPGYAGLLSAGNRGDARAYSQAVVDSGYCRDRACHPDQMGPSLAKLVQQFRTDRVFDGLNLPPGAIARRSSSEDLGTLIALALFIRKQQ